MIFPHLSKEDEYVEKEKALKEISTFKDENLVVVQEIVKTYNGARRGRKLGTKNKIKTMSKVNERASRKKKK